MVSSELRANARVALQGKWGKAALLTLCYFVITFVITYLLNLVPVVGPILQAVISLPLSFGFLASLIKLKRDEDVGYVEFFNLGFSNFGKVWAVLGNMILKMIVPIVLIIVFIVIMIVGMGGSASTILLSSSNSYSAATAGFGGVAVIGLIGYIASLIYAVIKGYLYSLSFYILYDNPDKSGKEIVEESATLMQGNRWRFFWLGLTFIGWVILSAFTFYIGMLWVMPYIMVAFVCFYEDLAGQPTASVENNDNPIIEE
jgi:uncharacterized membrane protein